MISPRPTIFARAIVIAVVATGALGWLASRTVATLDLDPDQPFAALLSQWCAVVLLGCGGWAWLVTMAVLVEAVRAGGDGSPGQPHRRRHPGVPATYRRIVLGACGVALAAGSTAPALATPGPVHLAPQVAAAAASATAPHQAAAPNRSPERTGEIVVQHGDSLWRLAAERLPRDASNATIAHTWHRLYAANEALIGPDPDRLEPGQRLARPRVW